MYSKKFAGKKILLALCGTGFALTSYAQVIFNQGETSQDIQHSINFLTSTNDKNGINYIGTAGALNGLLLPLSYYNTPDYWGKYVCKLPGNNCLVLDSYNTSDYTLTPFFGDNKYPGGDLQAERVNVANGADIYDTATWQIALALAGHAGLTGPNGQSLFAIADNHNKLLYYGYDGNNVGEIRNNANRAITTSGGTFKYNGTVITNPRNAYFFRMITRSWLSTDPFMGTAYDDYVHAIGLPPSSPYKKGLITWMDWKPITGENGWGFFVGPLQAEQIAYQAFPGTKNFVPSDAMSVQNAMDVLLAFQAMQSEIGGIYYATEGSLGNVGSDPVNPYQVSVENNASTLAGLLVFQNVLKQELAYDPKANKAAIQHALNVINTMINGGTMANGKKTEGLLSFFKNYAWDKDRKEFLQGGLANQPGKAAWQPTLEPRAVDVNTWGMAVIGQPSIDNWFGFGSAFNIWQNVKKWGGFYGPDGQIWGVGFSDQDGNGDNKSYKDGIMSAEWTAGAITMVRALITQYQAVIDDPKIGANLDQKNQARDFINKLKKDHDSMMQHIMSLRTDAYPTETAFADARPADYASLVPMPADKLGFMYASRRYFIPFGWFANPIPSTTGTAWSVMLYYNFNPFTVDGSYDANIFATPTQSGPLTKAVTATVVNEIAGRTIGINYKISGSDQWNYGPHIDPSGSLSFTFPKDTNLISIAYQDGNNWWGACQLVNPGEMQNFNPVKLHAVWTNSQGTGECGLTSGVSSVRAAHTAK